MLCVLCAIAVIISVYSAPSVATPMVYDSAQSEKPVDQDSEPVLAHRDFPRGLMLPERFWWLELSGQSLGEIVGVLHSDVRCDCGAQS